MMWLILLISFVLLIVLKFFIKEINLKVNEVTMLYLIITILLFIILTKDD
jgi:hypothetical protein